MRGEEEEQGDQLGGQEEQVFKGGKEKRWPKIPVSKR